MSQHDAIIRIKNLRLRTFIGIKEEEIANRQDIIQYVENNRFALLEKLTQDVLDIAREHHWVTYAEVEIDKLHALRYADSVSMTLSWQRQA